MSLANISQAIDLPKLDDLPVVGRLRQTELASLSVVTAPMAKASELPIITFSTTLPHPLVKIGPLEMQALILSTD